MRWIKCESYRWAIALLVVIASSAIAPVALSASPRPGALDPGFAGDGLAIESLAPGKSSWVEGLVVQPSGRTVLATHDRIVRYRRDGSRDRSFSVRHVPVLDLAAAPDGGLVRLGPGEVERLLPDGQPDPSFGSSDDGRVLVPTLQLFELAVDTAGRIVVAGRDPEAHMLAVARFLPDGGPDPGFGTLGIVRTAVSAATPANLDVAKSVAVAPDGGILVGGSAGQAEECLPGALHCWGPYLNAVVLRYGPNGTLDRDFGEEGVFRGSKFWGSGRSVAARPGGGVLFVPGGPTGAVEPGGGPRVAAVALTGAGELDRSFAGDGSAGWFEGIRRGFAAPRTNQLLPVGDGRILACGGMEGSRREVFILAMLRGDGEPARAFGHMGLVVTRLGRKDLGWAGADALALAPREKLYVAGHVDRSLVVTRYRLRAPGVFASYSE